MKNVSFIERQHCVSLLSRARSHLNKIQIMVLINCKITEGPLNENGSNCCQDEDDDKSNGSRETDDPTQPGNYFDNDDVNQEITCALLKALKLVEQMEGSVADFEDVLQLAKDLYCRDEPKLKELWPNDWRETQTILKKCGYKDPKEFHSCLDDSHYCHWGIMDHKEALCKYCDKQGTNKYYYSTLVANENMCKKMMGYWEDRCNWMGNRSAADDSNILLKEIWRGSRFRTAMVWDQNSNWMLPIRCIFCRNVISIHEIQVSQSQ